MMCRISRLQTWKKIDPKIWKRMFFHVSTYLWVLLNNTCELYLPKISQSCTKTCSIAISWVIKSHCNILTYISVFFKWLRYKFFRMHCFLLQTLAISRLIIPTNISTKFWKIQNVSLFLYQLSFSLGLKYCFSPYDRK